MMIGKMTDEEAINLLENVNNMQFSEEQKAIATHRDGACIVATAGSGKTTMLINLLAKRILTGEIKNPSKVLCTTYSNAGVDELSARIKKLFKSVGISGEVNVKTLHSTYNQVIKDFGYGSRLMPADERYSVLRERYYAAGLIPKEDDLATLSNLLSYQVNKLLSDKELYRSYVYTLDELSLEKYSQIRKELQVHKQETGQIDFDDMQLIMYDFVARQRRQDVLDYCRTTWKEYYIDEAQDMSKIQDLIMSAVIADEDKHKAIFIGDDDQCIYQWRGAEPNILLDTPAKYGVKQLYLSTNYRCRENIVRYAADGIEHNIIRNPKDIQSIKTGGIIKINREGENNGKKIPDTLANLNTSVYNQVIELLESGESPLDIAVLSRNNRELQLLHAYMLTKGVYCGITSEMGLHRSEPFRVFKSAISMAEENLPQKELEAGLWRFCSGMSKKNSKKLTQIQKTMNFGLADTIGMLAKFEHSFKEQAMIMGAPLQAGLDYKRPPGAMMMEMESFAAQIREETCRDLYQIYLTLRSGKAIEQKITEIISQVYRTTLFAYPSSGEQRFVAGTFRLLNNLVTGLGLDQAKKKMNLLEQYEKGFIDVGIDKVQFSTMHGAKGKEWKHVIIIGADNHSVPSFYGLHRLNQKGVAASDILSSIREDRRLFYVAMTRAKDTLTFYGDLNHASVYMLESLGLYTWNDVEDGKSGKDQDIYKMALNPSIYEPLRKRMTEFIDNRSTDNEHNEKMLVPDYPVPEEYEADMDEIEETDETNELDFMQGQGAKEMGWIS
jgi:DNA helicase-2/ATP-dependent DNA helicase PcrA